MNKKHLEYIERLIKEGALKWESDEAKRMFYEKHYGAPYHYDPDPFYVDRESSGAVDWERLMRERWAESDYARYKRESMEAQMLYEQMQRDAEDIYKMYGIPREKMEQEPHFFVDFGEEIEHWVQTNPRPTPSEEIRQLISKRELRNLAFKSRVQLELKKLNR